MKYRNQSLLILKPFERGCRNLRMSQPAWLERCASWDMIEQMMQSMWGRGSVFYCDCFGLWTAMPTGQREIMAYFGNDTRNSKKISFRFICIPKIFLKSNQCKYLLPPQRSTFFYVFTGFYKVLKHFCSFSPKPWFFKRGYYIYIYFFFFILD